MSHTQINLDALEALIASALMAHETGENAARSVARALTQAEADGQAGHGLSRVPAYAAQAASGKVDGHAVPESQQVGSGAVRIDARNGFAFPALDLAVDEIAALLPTTGIAVAAITRSHHFGAAGLSAEALADRGFIALVFGNSPKAIAPWGGKAGVFGTNPIAFAAPRRAADPLVIDMSLSKVARGKVMVAAQRGEPIPEGWALDADGRSTTDASAALAGTMVPMGDAKGAALVMMVELLAAGLTGANFGFEASSFFTAEGPPPGVGQLIIGIDPGPLSGGLFADRLDVLTTAILDQPGTRLPGDRRRAARDQARRDGATVPTALLREVEKLAGAGNGNGAAN